MLAAALAVGVANKHTCVNFKCTQYGLSRQYIPAGIAYSVMAPPKLL